MTRVPLMKLFPISFNRRGVLHDEYYNIGKVTMEDRYLVQIHHNQNLVE